MKPAYCDKHGVQNYQLTSPLLADAISQNKKIDKTLIIHLLVKSRDSETDYLVDVDYLKNYIDFPDTENKLLLVDRDKTTRQSNDRLVIQNILRNMRWVCPRCLECVIER
jgi:excinuclease UvrABC helicase subunit UvrB